VPSFINYTDIIGSKILKKSQVTMTTPLFGVVYHRGLRFDTVNLHAKFYHSSFGWSRDIIEGVTI